MKHDQRFMWLDLIRGLSAIAVCAGHLRNAILLDYSQLNATSLLHQLLYFVTGLGNQAVLVFFVLSGFFVGGSVLKAESQFSWSRYAVARLTRLWVVLIPALILTVFIDILIETSAPDALVGDYHSVWHSGPTPSELYSRDIFVFAGNVFFLQTISTPVFGTNGPLWSLANEFWYYVMFPLCVYVIGRHSDHGQFTPRLTAACIVLGLLVWLPTQIRLGFIVWLMGVLVWIYAGRIPIPNWVLLSFGIIAFLGALIYSKLHLLQLAVMLPIEFAVGASFSILAVSLIKVPTPQTLECFLMPVARGMSELSYSLYLTHFPVVLLIAVTFYRSSKLPPDFIGLLHYFGWLMVLLVVGVTFWWAFERWTYVVRRVIANQLKLAV